MTKATRLAICGGQPVRTKPFPAFPVSGPPEMAALREAIRKGKWSGHAATALHARFEDALAGFHGTRYTVLTTSCTASLEVAMEACGVKPGDEVIVSPYTCIANPEAILRVGAIPVFGDIDPNTYGMDLSKLNRLVTKRTSCIIDIHFGGYLNDMDAMRDFTRKRGLILIEDAALAHGAEWRGRKVGQWGDAACLSLGFDKLVTVGEGGFILTNDAEIARRCRMIRSDGRAFLNRNGKPFDYEWAFSRGRKVDPNYTMSMERLGWNYRMPEILAALGWAQFRRYPEQLERRDENGQFLGAELARIPWIRPLPRDSRQTLHPYSIFIFTLEGPLKNVRVPFIRAVQAELTDGIWEGYQNPVYAAFYLQPEQLKRASIGFRRQNRRLDYGNLHCPEAEKACRTCVWIWHNMLLGSHADMCDIVTAIGKVADNLEVLEKKAHAIKSPPSVFGW